ncbi:MAG: hypothetical protein WCF65_00310 [Parachlamydiaceae bacterium]
MVKKWVTLTNYAACGVIAVLLLASLYFTAMRQRSFTLNDTITTKLSIPKGAFTRPPQEYEGISNPALTLKFAPLSVQLPDLRRYLLYYGKNGRPDATEEQPTLFFSFTGNKSPTSVLPGERVYILYDKTLTPNQYVFSPKNVPTALWFIATSQGNQSLITVGMDGGNGVVISEPTTYASFTLPEKEFVRFGSNATPWELGKWRVDGTLLARQKAKWYGIDKFLEKHSGDEYKSWVNKQRIDFGELDDIYSVYVAAGDCLIWDNGIWKYVKPGEASLKHILMCVKKIDERVMNFELWDVDGKGKISLNLVKVNEPWVPQSLEQNFKFIGSRTRSQFVFEINKERMLLSPNDWLLLTGTTWRKLVTPQEIDDYVSRKKIGPLFVFDKVERKDDRQIVVGTLFNSARTEMTTVEFPLQQSKQKGSRPGTAGKMSGDDKRQKTKESNPSSMLKTGNGTLPGQHSPPQIRPYTRENGPVRGPLPVDVEDDDEDDNDDDDDEDYED